MGFFKKLFERNLDEEPFMPGKVVVVAGFGPGRIQRTDTINGVPCFVVTMENLPPRSQNLYVADDSSGFPMRVPIGRADAERYLSLLVPGHDKAPWEEVVESFADVRQRSKSAGDLQRLLGFMYPSVDLSNVHQRHVLRWVEDALLGELAHALGRSRDELRAEVRARFSLPASTPKKTFAVGAAPDAPLIGDLAPIGSFHVEGGITVSDPLSALDDAEELAKPEFPVTVSVPAKKGVWHAYVRRAKDDVIDALIAVHSEHASAVPNMEIASVLSESQYLAILDSAVATNDEFVSEELEYTHENFPRITDGRGAAIDLVPAVPFPVRVAKENDLAVWIEVSLVAQPDEGDEP